jgi:FkbM family methyltransferase
MRQADSAMSPLQRRLLAKAEAEAAMIARPEDQVARDAAFASLAALAAGHTGLLHLLLPELGQPLHLRAGTADLAALRRVFDGTRHGWSPARPPRRILDLGAHAGYAAVALAQRWPDAEILCVEPDLGAHRLLAMNTLAWPGIRRSPAAAWHSPAMLGPAAFGDGFDGALTDSALPEARTIPAVPVALLLEQAGWPGADLVLCDIAGSEAAVFADPNAAWLRHVETAAIDIRDDFAADAGAAVRACFPDSLFAAGQAGATMLFRRHTALAFPPPAPPRRLALLHASPGLLPFILADIGEGGFRLLGDHGLRLRAADQPPPRVIFPRTLAGHTHLVATIRHEGGPAPLGFAATLADAAGSPIARAALTLAADAQATLSLAFPQPMHGRHRLILETSGAPAWGAWLAPAVV